MSWQNCEIKDGLESRRKGDTGIGKTIEDYLGIRENNMGDPDCLYRGKEIEIKSHRSAAKSMITLFTLEAGTRHLNDIQLIERYGYQNGKGRPGLKVTLSSKDFTPQGLKIEIDETRRSISIVDRDGYRPWTWTTADIHLKLHNLCIVYADAKKQDAKEYFRIERAILATGLNDQRFFELVARGILKIDLRMHLKPNGKPRNHGTGFRLANYDELMKCYDEVETILGVAMLDARNPE